MDTDDERVVLAAFLASALLAGGNAVAIRFSNRELEPLWGAGLRFSLAAALLVAVMAALRLAVPTGKAAIGALLYGSLSFGAAFALFYYALVELQAGFGQIVLALVPLATLLLAVLQRQERLRLAGVAGALVGFARHRVDVTHVAAGHGASRIPSGRGRGCALRRTGGGARASVPARASGDHECRGHGVRCGALARGIGCRR